MLCRMNLRIFSTRSRTSTTRPGMVQILIEETLVYRDMLRGDTGETLTVGDTRAALDALEDHLRDQIPSIELTKIQQVLFERWKKALAGLQRSQ